MISDKHDSRLLQTRSEEAGVKRGLQQEEGKGLEDTEMITNRRELSLS